MSVTLIEVPDWLIFRNNNIYIFCLFLSAEDDGNNFGAIWEISGSTWPTLVYTV